MEYRVIAVALERSNRAEIYLDALVVSLSHHLAVGCDEVVGALLGVVLGAADVVDTFKYNQRRNALLTQNVAVKTFQSRFAESALDYGVATDAKVQYAHLAAKTLGEEVSPTVLLVGGGAASVGDAIAEGGDYGKLLGGLHFERSDIVPMIHLLLRVVITLWLALAADDVRRSARTTVRGGVFGSLVAIVDGDAQKLQRLQVVGKLVGIQTLALFEGNVLLAVEGEILGGLGVYLLCIARVGYIYRADVGIGRAKSVRQLQSQRIAAGRNVDNHPHRPIGKACGGHIARTRPLHGSSPRALPILCAHTPRRHRKRKKRC